MPDVLAFHVVFGCYGFWLPNDPRGSGSKTVRSQPLQEFGKATWVESGSSRAAQSHDHARRLRAKEALKYPPVRFQGVQALDVARGFSRQIQTSGFVIWGCAIMPDHVHLVVRRHRYKIDQVVRLLKQSATRQLLEEERHPFANRRLPSGRLPSVWQQDFRKIFLYSDNDIRIRIDYVNNNPLKAGLKSQNWSFVVPFSGL